VRQLTFTKEIRTGLTISEFHTLALQIGLNRHDNRIVLIERSSIDTCKRVDSMELMDEPVKVSPEFHRAMPWLKGKPSVVST
jgi:hypothetical protein